MDRYVWIHGMLFAYLHPRFEAALQRMDKFAVGTRLFIRTAIIAGQPYFQFCGQLYRRFIMTSKIMEMCCFKRLLVGVTFEIMV